MDLQNRENFLNKLAAKMGKARAIIPEPMDVPVNTYPTERFCSEVRTEQEKQTYRHTAGKNRKNELP